MNIKNALTTSFYKVLGMLISLSVAMGLALLILLPARADNPTFFLSTSAGCGSAVTSLDTDLSSNVTVYLCIDAENEGEGLLGAETHLSYDTSAVSVSNVQCNVFDTCIDLSESGAIKFLGASGPLPEGTPATAQEALGSFSAHFSSPGTASFSFTLSQVINDQQDVENRTALGLTVNVSEEEAEEEEEMTEEQPAEESAEAMEEEPMDEIEEPAEETEDPMEEEAPVNPDIGISAVVITPLAGIALPGSQVQIISRADYLGGRASDNITSCFPCPTPDNSADGNTTYNIVNGPASFVGSKVTISAGATPGQVITLNASYSDNVSGTGGQSADQYITVVSELPQPPAEEPEEDEATPEEVAAPEEPDGAPAGGGEGEEESETQQEAQSAIDSAKQAQEDAADDMGETPSEEDQDAYDEGSQLFEEAQTAYDEGNYDDAKTKAEEAEAFFESIQPEEASTPEETEAPEEGEFHPAAEDYQGLAEAALKDLAPQQNSDVVIPTEPAPGTCAAFSQTQDSDGDGLSDRTECYLGTSADNPDSDGDSCWDGEEINRFYSNPLTSADCNVQQILEENILIVDPKPDWIVKRFDISGTTPSRSQSVGITAIPAVHEVLTPVISGFSDLALMLEQEADLSDTAAMEAYNQSLEDLVSQLQNSLNSLTAFLDNFSGEYPALSPTVANASDLLSQDMEDIKDDLDEVKAIHDEMAAVQTQPVFLGEITELQEVGAGQNVTAGFHLEAAEVAKNGVYDLIATAYLSDGSTLSSAPVRVILDSTVSVPDPTPQTLDGISLLGTDGPIQIQSGRPVLSGQSTYGVQLFATWESLVLASSIIADSSAGGFDIQAPREMESGVSHTVSVYAVHRQPAGLVRSNSVTVDFNVGAGPGSYRYLIYGLIMLVALLLAIAGLAALVAKRRMAKIDHLPPEHRAKENELYEAFGLEKPHTEEMPADHNERGKEMSSAFGGLNVDVEAASAPEQRTVEKKPEPIQIEEVTVDEADD